MLHGADSLLPPRSTHPVSSPMRRERSAYYDPPSIHEDVSAIPSWSSMPRKAPRGACDTLSQIPPKPRGALRPHPRKGDYDTSPPGCVGGKRSSSAHGAAAADPAAAGGTGLVSHLAELRAEISRQLLEREQALQGKSAEAEAEMRELEERLGRLQKAERRLGRVQRKLGDAELALQLKSDELRTAEVRLRDAEAKLRQTEDALAARAASGLAAEQRNALEAQRLQLLQKEARAAADAAVDSREKYDKLARRLQGERQDLAEKEARAKVVELSNAELQRRLHDVEHRGRITEEEARAVRGTAETELRSLCAERERLETASRLLAAKDAAFGVKERQLEAMIADLQGLHGTLRADKRRMKQARREWAETEARCNEEIACLKRTLAELQARQSPLTKEREHSKQSIAQQIVHQRDLEISRLQRKLATMTEDNGQLSEQVSGYGNMVAEMRDERESLKQQLLRLSEQLIHDAQAQAQAQDGAVVPSSASTLDLSQLGSTINTIVHTSFARTSRHAGKMTPARLLSASAEEDREDGRAGDGLYASVVIHKQDKGDGFEVVQADGPFAHLPPKMTPQLQALSQLQIEGVSNRTMGGMPIVRPPTSTSKMTPGVSNGQMAGELVCTNTPVTFVDPEVELRYRYIFSLRSIEHHHMSCEDAIAETIRLRDRLCSEFRAREEDIRRREKQLYDLCLEINKVAAEQEHERKQLALLAHNLTRSTSDTTSGQRTSAVLATNSQNIVKLAASVSDDSASIMTLSKIGQAPKEPCQTQGNDGYAQQDISALPASISEQVRESDSFKRYQILSDSLASTVKSSVGQPASQDSHRLLDSSAKKSVRFSGIVASNVSQHSRSSARAKTNASSRKGIRENTALYDSGISLNTYLHKNTPKMNADNEAADVSFLPPPSADVSQVSIPMDNKLSKDAESLMSSHASEIDAGVKERSILEDSTIKTSLGISKLLSSINKVVNQYDSFESASSDNNKLQRSGLHQATKSNDASDDASTNVTDLYQYVQDNLGSSGNEQMNTQDSIDGNGSIMYV